LGVPGERIPEHLDDQAALYRQCVAGKRMLILLDNARTSDQVRPLLPPTAGCLVLVTSRCRLAALDEASRLTLDVLPLADALTLFTNVAGSARVAGQFDAAERIVGLCGGLPLAIRIAVARLRSRPAWTLQYMLDRLTEEHGQVHQLDDGERSVMSAFALSYRALPAEQQRMFRLLGLMPGQDADPYAAAALTGTTPALARQSLEGLLDTHLLNQLAEGRYRFHDLMRAHAAVLADQQHPEPDRTAALARLLDYYLHAAENAVDLLYPEGQRRSTCDPAAVPPIPLLKEPRAASAWLETERGNRTGARPR